MLKFVSYKTLSFVVCLEEGSENTCSGSVGSVHSEDLRVNFGTEVEGTVTGTADKTVADRTLGRLTRIPNSTITAFYFHETRNILSQKHLDYPVTVTQRWVLFEIAMVNGKNFTIS